MANRGLKNYLGLLTTKIDGATGYVDVNSEDSNLLMLIPLFNIAHLRILI